MAEAKCPVCDGKGYLPAGFYTPSSARPETCRSCGGRGSVAMEEARVLAQPNPLDLTYDP